MEKIINYICKKLTNYFQGFKNIKKLIKQTFGLTQFVKVRKLKSLRTQVPKVNKPNPAINIIKAATLYLVASDPLLSKKVSAAKEFG